MRQVERGDTIPQPEHLSWLRHMDAKLRGIYASLTCRRSTDVVVPRPAHHPPRPSVHRSEPRHSVQHSEPRHSVQQPRLSVHQPSPSQLGSSSWNQPSPSQPGTSSWSHQMELGNTTLYILFNIVLSQNQFYMFYFTAVTASRNRSCIQCSHRCLVVLLRS